MRPIRHTRLAVTAIAVAGMLWTTAATGASANSTAELESSLDAVEASAASASARALAASAAADEAREAADAAAERAAALDAQVAATEVAQAGRNERLGAVATAMYRASASGPLLAQVLTTADPETLLSRLGTWERVGKVSAQLTQTARATADVTASQRSQAVVARAERERLASEAEAAAAIARAEAESEQLAVARAQGELDALYERLAEAERVTAAQAKAQRVDRKVAEQAAANPVAGAAPVSGQAPPTTPAAPATPTPPPPPAPPAQPPPSQGAPVATPAEAQALARSALSARGWGDDQHACLVRLWNRESGWRVQARNPSSGAYGIPQAYPAEKMAAAGPDWRTSAATQISWGLSYISARYGTPCGAWDHSERTGWY